VINPQPAARADGPRAAQLEPLVVTPAQAEVLGRLRTHGTPVTAAQLATAAGQHVNTVREHLDALVDTGVAERTRMPVHGRGRPAYGYAVSARETTPAAHVALVDALATHLRATDAAPAAAAEQLGRRYAADLHLSSPKPRDPARRALAAVVDTMTTLGFGCEVDRSGTTARLVTCPMLEAARRHEGVICSFHRGVVTGIAERQTDRAVVELHPFAEPGACRLHAAPAGAGA
jgi:predicted ArsR family transcriptional regulator